MGALCYSRLEKVGMWMWSDLYWLSFFPFFEGSEDANTPTFWRDLYSLPPSSQGPLMFKTSSQIPKSCNNILALQEP